MPHEINIKALMAERDAEAKAVAALLETLQLWRPVLNAAIAAAPRIDAVQNLRGITAAIDDITRGYPEPEEES